MKYIIIVAIAILTLALGCGSTVAEEGNTEGPISGGAALYKKYCTLCHGADGKKGFNGAKDLTASILLVEERVILIREGKGLMTPYKGLLSEEEIRAVAEFSLTLTK